MRSPLDKIATTTATLVPCLGRTIQHTPRPGRTRAACGCPSRRARRSACPRPGDPTKQHRISEAEKGQQTDRQTVLRSSNRGVRARGRPLWPQGTSRSPTVLSITTVNQENLVFFGFGSDAVEFALEKTIVLIQRVRNLALLTAGFHVLQKPVSSECDGCWGTLTSPWAAATSPNTANMSNYGRS